MPYNIPLQFSDIRFFARVYPGLTSINRIIDLGRCLHMILLSLPLIACLLMAIQCPVGNAVEHPYLVVFAYVPSSLF